MKPISKYRQKVLDRQPPTLLGQRLAEALKANGPSAANTRPVNCVNPDHRSYEDGLFQN